MHLDYFGSEDVLETEGEGGERMGHLTNKGISPTLASG
jgi:hypothetical protein